MDVEKDRFCKSDNSERRLRLRKNCKESTSNKAHLSDNSNNENSNNDTTCTPQSSCDEDSILDFKSPKRIFSVQSKIINRFPDKTKKKLHSKPKIISNERKSKTKTVLHNKKIHDDVQQSLIESSFFKSEKKEVESPQSSTENMKTAYVCPLCFKNLKDESSQTIHMKSCAAKNNVSTKKLMDAVELQERQAAERKSLGLLHAPLLQDKKKPAPRTMTSRDDPDLQLALALSKSLYEKEEMEEWDEAQIVTISSDPSVSDNNAECLQKMTLQSFGFSSNRNIIPTNNWPTSKTKKRKLIEPTILQRRTAVERERILTERIAEILMGCKDFTQRSQEKIEEFNDAKTKIILKSQLLQQLHKIENPLWSRTKLILTQDIFYVEQLSPHIISLEKKEQKLNEEQNFVKPMEVNERNVRNERSLDNEQIQEMKEIQTMKTMDNDETLTISSSTVSMCCKEKIFLNDLATSWRNILNDSSASDIIVFVKNSRHIWTHKLVFYTRCSNILLDVISNDTEFSTAKEKICWLDIDYDVALAFLEFVYCGIIDRYSKILDSEVFLSSVRALGRKYKIHDLFTYLCQKKSNIAEVKENLYPLEKNYTSAKNLCVLQDEKTTLMKSSSSDEINSRSNTPVKWETSASPDMFDDTPVMKHSDKSTIHSKDPEDSNIHILLSLIKQDTDIDICSQKLLKSAQYSELDKDIPTCSKNMEQNVMKIDPESNSLKCSIDNMHKDSLIDTPQSSKSINKYIQDHSSEIIKQKSNLTLFIENIQKENAKLDAVLDSNIEHLVQISPRKQKNPFYVDKHDNFDFQSYDNNIEQLEARPGRLTMIEQHMQSFATKNPEFYSRLSNEQIEDVQQTDNSHINSLSPKIIESSHNNILNCTQNFISPDEKHVNISEQITTVPIVCSQQSETMNQSFSNTFLDSKINEEDISMYSKYMRDHKDNSIAKYRTAINRNKSDSNLSDKSMSSDSIHEDNNINEIETDKILNQCVLTQKDTDVIVSSDTDIESVSSNVNHIVSENDFNHENTMFHSLQQSRKEIEDNKQDVENENSNQLLEVETFSNANTEEEKDINSAIKSNRDKLNTEIMSMTQKSGLNDNQRKESISSPIMISSSPDFSNNESCSPVSNMKSLFQDDLRTKNLSDTSACKLRKPVKFSLNFEDDIYLANVDVDKYEKPYVLEKSLSFNTLSTELKNTRKCNNKNNHKNIKDKDETADGNLDNKATFFTQNFTNIKKFQRKSLSEGHIDTNKLYNQGATSTHVAMQFQCNYTQNIGNTKMPKITDKDVTPPPDYNDMSSPELHREMKKYGLKIQKRSRAVKLLTYIYNELHPLVPEKTIREQVTEISSDEDEGPPMKKRHVDDSLEKSSNAENSDNELPCSQDSNDSVNSAKGTINKEMQFYETMSLMSLENSSDITDAFMRLINMDKDLHNKILRYEPVNIEQLRSMLQTRGFKCKLSNLMSFLDQQCITFYAPEQSVKSRTRRKT